MKYNINCIAKIYNDYTSKFGIPKQSNIVNDIESVIVFEKEYRNSDAVRGLEEFSHIWLLWIFSEIDSNRWSPTVRPPRLGGNKRMGVFATRSPFRPNPLGLSSVKIERVVNESDRGPLIYVRGADLMNGTPICDIKPYIPYADCHMDAVGGFTDKVKKVSLKVVCDTERINIIPEEKRKGLIGILEQDPRPQYHDNPDRVYSFEYADYNIQFNVRFGEVHIVNVKSMKEF